MIAKIRKFFKDAKEKKFFRDFYLPLLSSSFYECCFGDFAYYPDYMAENSSKDTWECKGYYLNLMPESV